MLKNFQKYKIKIKKNNVLLIKAWVISFLNNTTPIAKHLVIHQEK